MYNWNVVYVKYCDASSYAGDSSVLVPIPSNSPGTGIGTGTGAGMGASSDVAGGSRRGLGLSDAVGNATTSSTSSSTISSTSGSSGSSSGASSRTVLVHFRGRRNREGIVHHLLSTQGMHSASDIVIGGCSAGALGVFLGLDQMAEQVRDFVRLNASTTSTVVSPSASSGGGASPGSGPVIVGFADSGFFMAHTSDSKFKMRKQPKDGPAGVDLHLHEALINGVMDYQGAMREVYRFMNISSGTNPRCVKFALQSDENLGRRRESTNCIFPQHLSPVIRTPLFAKQPKYDQWQIWHVVGKPNNSSLVNNFGSLLLSQLQSRLLTNPRHGAFVDSCTHHCTSCSSPGEDSWHGDTIRSTGATRSTAHGLTASDTFEAWLQRERRIQQGQGGAVGAVVPGAAAGGVAGGATPGAVSGAKWTDDEAVFAIQDRLYPCSECCRCHA